MATASPTLRERAGGRWAISWPVFWAMVAAVALTTASIEPTALAYGANVWRWAVVIVVAIAVLGAAMLIAGTTFMRNRATHPVPLWCVIAVGSVLGFTRVAVVIWVGELLGLPPIPSHGVRLVGGALIAPIIYVLIVVLVDELDRRRTATHALQQRLVDVRAAEVERDELVVAMTDRVYAEVLQATEGARADLDAPYDAMDPAERLQAAARLRQAVVEDLRPLSHRLDAARAAPLPDMSLWQAMKQSFGMYAVQPVAAATLATVTALPLLRTDFRWWGVVAIIATYWLAVYLPLALAKWLARRGGIFRDNALVIGLALVLVASSGRLLAINAITDHSQGIRYLGNAIWLVVAVLITGVLGAVLGGEERMAHELEQEVDRRAVDAAVADRELARVSREMAQYVHGTLQGTLLATAFAIEDATRRGDDAGLARALDQAQRALGADAPIVGPASTVTAELDERAAMWRGFTAVDVQVHAALGDLPAGTIADVGRVVEEAIGNAHKHGAASRVEVVVEPVAPGVVRVRVSDDGPGPSGGVHGMGFTWLDFAAPGRWHLQRGGPYGGSVLTVDLSTGA